MIQAAEADIVAQPSPPISQTDFSTSVGIGQQLFMPCTSVSAWRRAATCSRRASGVASACSAVQLCRQLVGESAQQAHHALTMLIDG